MIINNSLLITMILTTIAQLQKKLSLLKFDQTIGFVPTMGALHLGHQSLITTSVNENDFTIVSIFVNPLQFSVNEDFSQYPSTLDGDRQICEKLGVDCIFVPSVEEIINSETTLVIPPVSLTSVLCGKYRENHFTGVATIVTKLFNLIRPTFAYFGEKDAQQLAIIKRLVKDLNFATVIKSCPIIREVSGLAYSSRNQYLSTVEKEEATILFQSLTKAKQAFSQGEINCYKLINIVTQELLTISNLKIQYVEIVDFDTLQPLTNITNCALLAIAIYLGKTRLIDNMKLEVKKPIIAIDGPAGAGKSTISRVVAQKLGLLYLDTGAMYRAITWLVMEQNIAINDEISISKLLQTAILELIPSTNLETPIIVKINNQDVTKAIRSQEVTSNVSKIASQKAVREKLVQLQQEWGEKGGLVAEGRDIGTNVFPHAKLKIFLTASVEERAKRRLKDLENQGYQNVDLIALQEEIGHRDYLDTTREISPLQQAEEAIAINTDNLTIEEVSQKIIELFI